MDTKKKLIKILNRERRELKAEVEYLKSMLWDATHDVEECDHDGPHVSDTSPDQNSFPIPEPEPESGEEVRKSIWDASFRDIIGDLFNE